jgi:septum formation protein
VRFILASASPARLETLRRAGLDPEVIVSGVDETQVDRASTAELVEELAWLKASAVAEQIDEPALVLGCDSLLELHGRSLGKPDDVADARQRWLAMRGQSGVLHTGHALLDTTGRSARETGSTAVRFGDITDDEIDRYCATGEPVAVAGAFTVDGLGGWFIDSVEGDYHNVVGVSLPLLRRLLRTLGYSLADIGYPRS